MKNEECPSDLDLVTGLMAGEDAAIGHRGDCRDCQGLTDEVSAVAALLQQAGPAVFSARAQQQSLDDEHGDRALGGFVRIAAAITLAIALGVIMRGLKPVETGSWSFRGTEEKVELTVRVQHREGGAEAIVGPVTDADRYELHVTMPTGEQVLVGISQEPKIPLPQARDVGAGSPAGILWHVEAWRGLDHIGSSVVSPLPPRP